MRRPGDYRLGRVLALLLAAVVTETFAAVATEDTAVAGTAVESAQVAEPAGGRSPHALSGEIDALTGALTAALASPIRRGRGDALFDGGIDVRDCADYPYGESGSAAPAQPASLLVGDLVAGLETGLRCLVGAGPAGPLHDYHAHQARRLLSLLRSDRTKTFRCIADDMFATAVATGPDGVKANDPLYGQLRDLPFPGVLLDTYRLGGILSQRHDDRTYREFFRLAEAEIVEHRNGNPLRPASLHRYRNRPALLFHETVHWLGHEHSALYPDVTHLYETCCFGGGEYISDAAVASSHQAAACDVLRDAELWDSAHNRYRQMRIWHAKGYDELKLRMRADYDR